MIKTVKQACVFNPIINDYRMAEGIENLADLIADKGDGREFFARNFITQGMEQLFKEGMLRLSGKSDQAVFELTQAMGGGKTHMMVALGLLARYPQLRPDVLPADLNSRVDFGSARIAAFNGRNSPDNYIWGEIASQLGAAEAIKPFWVNGPRTVDLNRPGFAGGLFRLVTRPWVQFPEWRRSWPQLRRAGCSRWAPTGGGC